MSSLPPPTKTAIPAWKWWAVLMMLLATVVNYMDRQALGSMASFIKGGQVPCLSGPGRRPALHSEYTGLTDALDRIPDSAGETLEAEWVKHLMTAAARASKAAGQSPAVSDVRPACAAETAGARHGAYGSSQPGLGLHGEVPARRLAKKGRQQSEVRAVSTFHAGR